jgi:hypothetical protein
MFIAKTICGRKLDVYYFYILALIEMMNEYNITQRVVINLANMYFLLISAFDNKRNSSFCTKDGQRGDGENNYSY